MMLPGCAVIPKRPSVLTVINYYYPYISGLSEYARLVAENMVADGMDVTVLTGRYRKDLAPTEAIAGVQVIRAAPFVYLHKGYLSTDFIVRYAALCRRHDVVLMHLPMLESGLLTGLGPRSQPLAVVYHCDVTPSREGSLIDRAAVAAVRASCRFGVRRADKIIVSSMDYAAGSEVLRGMEHKLVEAHAPDKAPVGPLIRQPLASPAGPARIGFLGRFVEEKGIDILLDAVPLVLDHAPNAKFLLAGDHASVAGGSQYGLLRDRLHRLKDNVEVLGRLSEEELFPFYRSLDLFLLPSVNSYEAFGMVQVEAMKSGVPVIATDLRGVRVPVQKTGNGSIVPPRDARALAEAILAGISVPAGRTAEQIAAKAWEVFRHEATLTAIAGLVRQMARANTAPANSSKK
jgi:glycosyltransferase involved in cell wall biosynthesis